MSITLNFYPKLTEELTLKVGFTATGYVFSYQSDGREYNLESRLADAANNEVILVSDERNEWAPETHDLCIRRKVSIYNPNFLFGPNGLAGQSAELGLAMLWTSKSSNQRGVYEIGSVRNIPGPLVYSFSYAFPPGSLRGRVQLQIILYLRTPGDINDFERHLANETGTVLGTLDNFTIVLEGSGSVFPIVEVPEPLQPLWWVRCDWVDPQVDAFEVDNVRICLNSAHPEFKLLKENDNTVLLREIIASAMQLIVEKVKESGNWDEIIIGKNCENGSIAEAVHYFVSAFGWDTSSPERLAATIRKDLESRF